MTIWQERVHVEEQGNIRHVRDASSALAAQAGWQQTAAELVNPACAVCSRTAQTSPDLIQYLTHRLVTQNKSLSFHPARTGVACRHAIDLAI